MASFTISALAAHLPKMGPKAKSLLTAGVEADVSEAAQIEAVKAAWRGSVEAAVRQSLTALTTKQLAEIVEEHEMINGDRPAVSEDGPSAEAVSWDSDLDDAIQAAFDDKFWKAVGPSGMVELTTDTAAHDAGNRAKLAAALVDQIVANGQWLVLTDAEAKSILSANPPKAAAREEDPAVTNVVVEDTPPSFKSCWASGLRMIRAAWKAETHDALSIYDELDGVVDSDDILSAAAASRLAPTCEAAMVRTIFQVIAAEPVADGGTWIDSIVMAAMEDETPEEAQFARDLAAYDKAQAPASPAAEPPASPVARTRRTPAQQVEEDAIATQVMQDLVKLSGMTEATMAEIIGVSRAMVNAALKGNKHVDWTPERRARLHQAAMEFATSAATFHESAKALAA